MLTEQEEVGASVSIQKAVCYEMVPMVVAKVVIGPYVLSN